MPTTAPAYFEIRVPRNQPATLSVPVDFTTEGVIIASARVILPDDIEQPDTTFTDDIVTAEFTEDQVNSYFGNRTVEVYIGVDSPDDERLLARGFIEFTDDPIAPADPMSPISVELGDVVLSVRASLGGPRGPTGGGGAVGGTHRHIQTSASATWTIVHGIGFWPNVTIVDTAHTVIEGQLAYPDADTVIVTFTAPVAGEAYLS